MGNKFYWIIIFSTLLVNVIMLQMTIESYFGEEYKHVWTFSSIAIISTIICLITFIQWNKQEYK
ncbi:MULTISPECIES: hypothetical protein [Metabacillus]|uniref:Uncharacterized protein n=2 Tax=Metabacillus TaxID=2675233 RepID=A0A179T7Z8_9BACI|nr:MULTISPECIES: hypothetical protein [Metabacillus]OAS88522.1 hypothetical protein A6K24_15830 [Metabacillus litoralis]QNF30406.1 hypothetical protein HUW50_24815 [Metabacillus sp. KUDC1714]